MRNHLKPILILSALGSASLLFALSMHPSGIAPDLAVARPQAEFSRMGQDMRRAGVETDPGLVRSRIGDPGSLERESMHGKLYVDFALIASYAVFFIAAGRLIAGNSAGLLRLMGLAVSAFGMLGAAADTAENLNILELLDLAPEAMTAAALQAIALPNLLKWAAISMALFNAAAGFLFLQYLQRSSRPRS